MRRVLVLVGFVQPEAGNHIPAIVGLPVDLRILPREDPSIRNAVDLVDMQAGGWRCDGEPVQRNIVLAVEASLPAYAVKQIGTDEQRRAAAQIARKVAVGVEIV